MTSTTANSNGRTTETSDVAKRILYGISGGALAFYGLRQRGLAGTALTIAGSALVARSLGGPNVTKKLQALPQKLLPAALTSKSSKADLDVRIERAVLITVPPFEVYDAWRDFEQLPNILRHIESVTQTSARTSHWKAKVVGGVVVEWDAELTEDVPGEVLCWRSLPGSVVDMVGTLRFEPALNVMGGTVLRVDIRYQPMVGGPVLKGLTKVLNKAVVEEVKEDLRRFKAQLEAGEVATTSGQPRGGKQKNKDITWMDVAGGKP